MLILTSLSPLRAYLETSPSLPTLDETSASARSSHRATTPQPTLSRRPGGSGGVEGSGGGASGGGASGGGASGGGASGGGASGVGAPPAAECAVESGAADAAAEPLPFVDDGSLARWLKDWQVKKEKSLTRAHFCPHVTLPFSPYMSPVPFVFAAERRRWGWL